MNETHTVRWRDTGVRDADYADQLNPVRLRAIEVRHSQSDVPLKVPVKSKYSLQFDFVSVFG